MKHDKIKYIIKTDRNSDVFQRIIERINSGEFENSETDDYGKVRGGVLENGRRIANAVIFKDLNVIKFVDENEFVTAGHTTNSNTTHCINARLRFYIQMEEGLTFTDYGASADFSEIDKNDVINYCKNDVTPEWSDSDRIEPDDIVS